MITQEEFDFLKGLKKRFTDSGTIDFSVNWSKEIESDDEKEFFMMDFHKNSIEVSKYTFNNRYRTSVVLFRLDIGGRHRNPDGEMLNSSHVHLFKEGYGVKRAYLISQFGFVETDSIDKIFTGVLEYLNIQNPIVQFNIF